MQSVRDQRRVYQFGVFQLDARNGELRKHGIKIRLQDQPCLILCLLLEHAGEVVTREQIQKHLWPATTFVDFDNAINSAVRKLRDALGDTAENPRFVETLARRGYRFVAPVATNAESTGQLSPLQPTTDRPATPAPVTAPRRRSWAKLAPAGALLGLGIALAIWLLMGSPRKPTELRVTPLTGDLGMQIQPSFSPDGTRVAYAWGGKDGGNFETYVKLIGSGDPVRIGKSPARDFSPAWSPDGRWIAVLRDLGREGAVMLIPASGGQYRELARVTKAPLGVENCPPSTNYTCGIDFRGSMLSWSRDGKSLFTSRESGHGSALAIVRIFIDTGDQQAVTSPPGGFLGDVGPAVSPDGSAMAFVRATALHRGDLYVVPLSGGTGAAGQPVRVTSDDADVRAPAWTEDSRELIFSSDRAGRHELWRISASPGAKPVRVAAVGENASDVAISPRGARLVYVRQSVYGSLWKVPIEKGMPSDPVRVTATTGVISFPHYSPDGNRIAFQSGHSGVEEIWICDADGTNAVQLTSFGMGVSGSPRWSPDGRTIAFDSNVAGNWNIYAIRSEGGRVVRLTKNQAENYVPNWSRDGQWIYNTSSRTGRSEIWKVRPDGSSETQVTTSGGRFASESANGKDLYYKNLYYKDAGSDVADVWKMPVAGGPQTKVLEGVRGRLIDVTEHGIYYPAGNRPFEFRFFDFASKSSRVIAPLGDWPYATVSPDERWAVYQRNEFWSTNLALVENFR